MQVIPAEAPVYGGGDIEISVPAINLYLTDEEKTAGRFYVVFLGSKLRHVTRAQVSWSVHGDLLLRSKVPGHNQSEDVELTVYMFDGNLKPIALTGFTFMSDSAHQMAILLAESNSDPSALEKVEHVCSERFRMSPEAQANFDERLTNAFKTVDLPSGWSLTGVKSAECEPRETLLHFAARLGLPRFSEHLLCLPGSLNALHLRNHEGLTPSDLARNAGFNDVADSLDYYQGQQNHSGSWRRNVSIAKTLSLETSKDIITTNLSWSYRDLDYDIAELERIPNQTDEHHDSNSNTRLSDDERYGSEGLSGVSSFELEIVNSMGKSDSLDGDNNNTAGPTLPTINVEEPPSLFQGGILEDNLRKLRDINENIQKLREHNKKQLLKQICEDERSNISSSCPSLPSFVRTSGFVKDLNLNERKSRLTAMSHHNLSFGSASHPSSKNEITLSPLEVVDATNVKIRVNDITPSSSQEFLGPGLAHSGLSHSHSNLSDLKLCSNNSISHIGGTTARRCAKRSGNKAIPRRQSWSSLGQEFSDNQDFRKAHIQRSLSLSSLDSDVEETFYDARETSSSSSTRKKSVEYTAESNLPLPQQEKQRSLSASSGEALCLPESSQGFPFAQSLTDVEKETREELESERTLSTGNLIKQSKREGLAHFLSARSTLQKSVSTPSILAAQEAAEAQASTTDPDIHDMHDMHDDPCLLMMEEEDEPEDLPIIPVSYISVADLLREGHLYGGPHDSDDEKPFGKRKKRGSLFFRKKKGKEKDLKKSPHQYVSVCYSTAVVCNVCNKPLANKPSLKCENCLATVHDSSCKDQILDCTKFKTTKIPNKPSNVMSKEKTVPPSLQVPPGRLPRYPYRYRQLLGPVSHSMIHLASAKSSSSTNVKDKKQQLPSMSKNQTQSSSATDSSKPLALSPSLPRRAYTPSGYSQWRRVATKLGVNKVINEEKEAEPIEDVQTNIVEVSSASMESLDEGAPEVSDLEDDPILRLMEEEPESWSLTMDKKTLKKLKDKDVKRQEAIYEVIITEKHHCLTLKIMQKMFAEGMMKELNMSKDMVERMFPCLEELLEVHMGFFRKLRDRQREQPVIEGIGDILLQQFEGIVGDQVRAAYGQFCSMHQEAVSLYKDIFKTDRKFQTFVKKCVATPLCKARGIPECILLVTQRVTKYPLLIDSLIKATKENTAEYQKLVQALASVKNVINQVDAQVAEKERERRLLEIYNRIDAKSTAFYKGRKFKKSDLLSNGRKLRYEGIICWKSARGKTVEVIAVVLSDVIFFLQENNQKYYFASLDNKSGVVPLQKLLVREKAGQYSRGIYLISSSPNEPEMYELVCSTAKERKTWIEAIRNAVDQCPEEDEGVPSESEEERKLEEARQAKLRELIGMLHDKDVKLAQLCEEKMSVLVDMMELLGLEQDMFENVNYKQLLEQDDSPEAKETMMSALNEACRLANTLYVSGTNLSRSVSSAGEHQSDAYISPLLPKRAETFGGFDNPNKEQINTNKVLAFKKKLLQLKDTSSDSSGSSKEKEECESELKDFTEAFLQVKSSEIRRFSGPLPLRPSSGPGSPVSKEEKLVHRKSVAGITTTATTTTASNTPDASATNSPQSTSGNDKDSGSEILRLTTTPLLMTQGKDQLLAITELTHHLNTLMCVLSHHYTTFEILRSRLSEANDKLSRLSKDNSVKGKSQYRPEHQLEELRNLQEQLSQEKSQWQRQYSEQLAQLEKQRDEVLRLQNQVKSEEADVIHQRELLYRKLEALQKEGIILSPSLTVVNVGSAVKDSDHSKSDDNVSVSTPHSDSEVTELQQTKSLPVSSETQSEKQTASPSFISSEQRSRSDPRLRSSASSSPSQLTKRESRETLPIHLCSATNMQKRQAVSSVTIKQQLPLKLATGNSAPNGLLNNNQPANMSSVSSGGTQQMLPFKLAATSSPRQSRSLPSSSRYGSRSMGSYDTQKQMEQKSHSAASSPSSTLTSPLHIRAGSSPADVHTPPAANSPPLPPSASQVLHQRQQQTDNNAAATPLTFVPGNASTSDKENSSKSQEHDKEIFC